jgi:aspartyl-tRNA(Asn)/glutamyl-tRNA(Gln) amidotransferase subunit A
VTTRGGRIFWARHAKPAPGPRLAVKDLFDTADLVTTYGTAAHASHRPSRTAEAVRLLQAAGWSVVGKTSLDELAYGMTGENPVFGDTPNPIAPGRMTGGSSAGSAAALAAHLADAALGSDSGGSLRVPAAFCGVVGFKPSYGLVPVDGCLPLAPSFDHAGPMGRSVATCTELMAALAPGLALRRLESLEELTVGLAWLDRSSAGVTARVIEAARHFPRRRHLAFPHPDDGFNWRAAFRHQVGLTHASIADDTSGGYTDGLRERIARYLEIPDEVVRERWRSLDEYRERAAEAMAGVDLLVTPTVPCVSPPLGTTELAGEHIIPALSRFTWSFNGLGWPALALPCGPAEHDLPASVQLVAPAGQDALVLAAGALLERALAL